jgi:hypothetical protein
MAELSFDFGSVVIEGVGLLIFVMGLTQFVKDAFKLDGNAVRFLSVGLGVVLMGSWEVRVFLPPVYEQVYSIVLVSLTAGLTGGGYYSLGKRFTAGNGERKG